ncbi:MAG: hypothetical protein VW774_09425 [Rhodospirillales bacterium]|jgi:hypothetical protein
MPSSTIRLNPLQQKTLTLLQEVARHPIFSEPEDSTGSIAIRMLPEPHGNHFHIGSRVVMSKDASGLRNQAVLRVLERKGMIEVRPGGTLVLTPVGRATETGLRDKILHGSDH